jgi:hypothetical protein
MSPARRQALARHMLLKLVPVPSSGPGWTMTVPD